MALNGPKSVKEAPKNHFIKVVSNAFTKTCCGVMDHSSLNAFALAPITKSKSFSTIGLTTLESSSG